jgi:hypothetical protein
MLRGLRADYRLEKDRQNEARGQRVWMPALFIPLMYVWYRAEPALAYLAWLWRGKRIADFLRRARDAGMRHQRVDGTLTDRTRR